MNSYQPSSVLSAYVDAESRELCGALCREMGVTRLARLTGLDKAGVPVWSAIRPTSMTWQASAGKGITDQQAIVSSIMECAETAHTEQYLRSSNQINTFKFTPDERMLHEIELESRKYIKGQYSRAKIDDMLGIKATELKSEVGQIVPMHWGYQSKEAVDYGFSTNGLSCSLSQTTARIHSLEEVYERHVFTSLSRNGKVDKTIIRAFEYNMESHDLGNLKKNLNDRKLSPVFLTTNTSSIPFVWCIMFDNDPIAPFAQVTSGYSCGRNYREAATRAFTEACQVRCSQIQGTREDFSEEPKDIPTRLTKKMKTFVESIEFGAGIIDKPEIEEDLYVEILMQSIPGRIYYIQLREMVSGCFACKVVAPECWFNMSIF